MKFSSTLILAIGIILALGCTSTAVKTYPFTYEASNKIEKVDPAHYPDRMGDVSRIIEAYRHKENPKAFVVIGGSKSKYDIDILLAGKSMWPDYIGKTIPGARDVSTKELNTSSCRYLLVKSKMDVMGEEHQFYHAITVEKGCQFHIVTYFPIGTPKRQIVDLLSIMETLKMPSGGTRILDDKSANQ